MSNEPWSGDEFLITLDLYLNKNGIIEDQSDSKVREVSSLINRSPSAVAMRLANYRSLDPDSTKGIENTGQDCEEI